MAVYELVARRHNDAGNHRADRTDRADVLHPSVPGPHERAIRGSNCRDRVTDPWLRALPLVGSVDQIVDSTDVLAVAGAGEPSSAPSMRVEHFPDVHGQLTVIIQRAVRSAAARSAEVAGPQRVGQAERQRLDPLGEHVDDALVAFEQAPDPQRG